MATRILEVCADSIDSVIAACQGSATRIELCSGLAEGGVTPSIGLVRAAMRHDIKVNVLIRPRGGDFIYSPEEVECMMDDISAVVAEGVNGVVIGALTPDGDVDMAACARLISVAGNAEITFHRAFDQCRDPEKALEDIISLGCHRLLTSGQAPTAEMGVGMLARLNAIGGGRISIMAGCGVGVLNARGIVEESGIMELHASARHRVRSRMGFRNEMVKMGASDIDDYTRMVTSADIVKSIIAEINSLND